MPGVVVAYAVRAPAGPERTDDVLGPRSGWVVLLGMGLRCRQLKPACARPSSAARSRLLPNSAHSGRPHSPALPRLPCSSSVLPHTPRLQALASEFWLVLGG